EGKWPRPAKWVTGSAAPPRRPADGRAQGGAAEPGSSVAPVGAAELRAAVDRPRRHRGVSVFGGRGRPLSSLVRSPKRGGVMLRANDKIGPYTLLRQLGRGSFGVVWLAERRATLATTQVALKLPVLDDPDLDDIKREARVWVQASGHPN